MLENPDQLARLRDDPSLIGSGIEELLRFTVPAEMATERFAREDIVIAGTMIPRGSLVLAVLGSAMGPARGASDHVPLMHESFCANESR